MVKLKGRPPVHSAETVQKIYELYDSTPMGYGLIAKELGMSRSTVQWYIAKRNKAKENPPLSNTNSDG